MQCFQKDPNLRVSARKLLKHPWVVNSKRSDSAVVKAAATTYDDTVKSIQKWNEALKSPDAGPSKRPVRHSMSPTQRRIGGGDFTTTPTKGPLALARSRPNTEAFMSPESAGGFPRRL
jgi:hypothetical protein